MERSEAISKGSPTDMTLEANRRNTFSNPAHRYLASNGLCQVSPAVASAVTVAATAAATVAVTAATTAAATTATAATVTAAATTATTAAVTAATTTATTADVTGTCPLLELRIHT